MTNTVIVATYTSIEGNWVEFYADGTVAEHNPYTGDVVVARPTADEYSVALNGMQEAAAVNAAEYAYQEFIYPLMGLTHDDAELDEAKFDAIEEGDEIDVFECVVTTTEMSEIPSFDYDREKSEYVARNTCVDDWGYALQVVLKEWEFDLTFNWNCKGDVVANC